MSADAFHVKRAREIAAAKEQGRSEGFQMAMSGEVPRIQAEARSDGLIVLLTGVGIGAAAMGFWFWLVV